MWRGSVVAALIATLCTVGCATSDDRAALASGATGNVEQGSAVPVLQIRPVLDERAARPDECPSKEAGHDATLTVAVCSIDGAVVYDLGPSVVDGSGVATARSEPDVGAGWRLEIGLDAAATLAFDSLTRRSLGQEPPQNQIALVTREGVISAPRVLAPIADGSIVVVGLSQDEARELADLLMDTES